MLDEYIPKRFCRELILAKENSHQLGMYMSVVLGLKPLMDDWIPIERMAAFRKACKKYALHIREDIIFRDADKEKISSKVVGREAITSTSGFGLPLTSRAGGSVHVFLSGDKQLLKEGMWYPAVIKDRVIFQPRADSLRYGRVLGYPECCIRFFRRYNDWDRYSYLYEAFRNTKGKPHFLCNPFLKYLSFSYIFHMPCSYNCPDTRTLVARIRKEIKKREPDFIRLSDYYLKKAFLVLYEMKVYGFEGLLKDNLIRYRKSFFLYPGWPKDSYTGLLKRGDNLRLQGLDILISKGKRPLGKIKAKSGGFAPERPFMIQFS